MINKLLSAAVKLYLRSQVEQGSNLQVKVWGKNKQILQGYIPQVFLSCDRPIYQGLHLGYVELKGGNIAINLPEVLKRKPLRLLEPVFVDLQLKLDADDLSASLESELLQSGLNDLWQLIVASQSASPVSDLAIAWQDIAINQGRLILTGSYQNSSNEMAEIRLLSDLSLADQHTLCLSNLKFTNKPPFPGTFQESLKIDLGRDVAISKLIVESEQIICAGKIRINN
ncbi:MAG: DUF2993 domain-containing protein [Cyanobacteria bacterium J06621_8]